MADNLVKRARVTAERLETEGLTTGAASLVSAMADRIEALERERADLIHDLERIKASETEQLNRAEALERELAQTRQERDAEADAVTLLLKERDAAEAALAEAVKMLDEQDRKYNRLTNDMIERHAALLATARADALRKAATRIEDFDPDLAEHILALIDGGRT